MRCIVINKSDGDFCLSYKAFLRLRDLGQREALKEPDLGTYRLTSVTPQEPTLNRYGTLIPRDDQKLVKVVVELGAQANGHGVDLKIVEIPSDVKWEIEKVGGAEHVSEAHLTEAHRTWHCA